MNIESTKLFFALNPKRSVTNSFGFIKKDMFDLFLNQSDWCVCIKCSFELNFNNLISIFALEGIEFGLSLISAKHLHFTYYDNGRKDLDVEISNLSNENNLFAITYEYLKNSYSIHINQEKVKEVVLENRIEIDTLQIKLFSICRQFAFKDKELATQNISVSNVLIASDVFNYINANIYFSKNDYKTDHYGRKILKENNKKNLYACYDFDESLNGKIWDLTCNNNFLYTSLDLKDRVGFSAI